MTDHFYLPEDLAPPVVDSYGLDAPYWEALRDERLVIQRCRMCRRHQWTPEWICHHCLSFDFEYDEVGAVGTIYSWERAWYPAHPSLRSVCPYLVVMVSLTEVPDIRVIGNLLGEPQQRVEIGSAVRGVFEHHDEYTLLQWQVDPST